MQRVLARIKKMDNNDTSFKKRVVAIVSKIPEGETMTYGEVAEKAGNPRASRVVGNIMKYNRDKSVPCHRVIRADGRIGEYNGLRGDKRGLLEEEGAFI